MFFNHPFVLAITGLLGLLFCGHVAIRAEWQWSVPDGDARAYLWIPPDCQRVRAIMVSNHNMIEQGILEHPTMRKTLAELGIAEIWVVPVLDRPFDFHKGAGEHFDHLMKSLAEESGYAELAVAPVIPLGHSACATFPWNLAAWNAGRTLAVLSVHGDAPQTNKTGYGGANVNWGDRNIDGVPGLMVMGEYEWGEERLTPAFTFMAGHPATPVAFLADVGHGHFDYSDQLVSFLAMFVRKAAEQRLPKDMPQSPEQAVNLKPVDPQAGWLIDRWHKDQPPASPAAPAAAYAGDRKTAFWCFDEEMAKATEAYYATARGKKPQLLGIVQGDETMSGEPCSPKFLTLDDGLSVHITTRFLDSVSGNGGNPARWAGAPNGTPLGHAADGGPIVLSKIVGPLVVSSPDTVTLRLDRSVYTADRRNNDMWVLASHPGDDQYKSAVQQVMIRAVPNPAGTPQTITFQQVSNLNTGKSIQLKAVSTAGLPVSYFVREGPAEIDGDVLNLKPVPPRAKYPVKVTVVAWQWGRSAEPKVAGATPVEMTFSIAAP